MQNLTVTYPQCFMFCGLSMRMASLILRSLSGQPLDTVILWSSDCLGLLGVGWSTTWEQSHNDNNVCELYNIYINTYINTAQRLELSKFKLQLSFLTFPSSLSSRANTPVLSVNSFTFTAGNGWVVVKSPWVPQLHTHAERKHCVRADDVSVDGASDQVSCCLQWVQLQVGSWELNWT